MVSTGDGCRAGLLNIHVLGAGLKWDVMCGRLPSWLLGCVAAPLQRWDVGVASSDITLIRNMDEIERLEGLVLPPLLQRTLTPPDACSPLSTTEGILRDCNWKLSSST